MLKIKQQKDQTECWAGFLASIGCLLNKCRTAAATHTPCMSNAISLQRNHFVDDVSRFNASQSIWSTGVFSLQAHVQFPLIVLSMHLSINK